MNSRIRGALLGHGIGDALGVPIEFNAAIIGDIEIIKVFKGAKFKRASHPLSQKILEILNNDRTT